jgi:hypothetical protein
MDETPRSNNTPSTEPVGGNSVVPGVHQPYPTAEPCQSMSGDGQRVGIAIQADQPQTGERVEETFGMPSRAQSGVEQHRPGSVGSTAGQRGGKQFDAPVEQHGNVSVIRTVCHDAPSDSTGKASMAPPPCGEVPVRVCEPGVGEVRQGRLGQRPHRTGGRFHL